MLWWGSCLPGWETPLTPMAQAPGPCDLEPGRVGMGVQGAAHLKFTLCSLSHGLSRRPCSFSLNLGIPGAQMPRSTPHEPRPGDAVEGGWRDPGGDSATRGFPSGHSPRAGLAFLTAHQLHTKAQWLEAAGSWLGLGVIREECSSNVFHKPRPRVPP